MPGAAVLREAILGTFSRPVDQPFADIEFDRLARDVFRFQYEHNSPYQAYCDRRRAYPGSIEHWTQIPPVPTAAFKEVALLCGDPAQAQAVFRTSGTTHGTEKRGTHYVLDLGLYHGSLLPNFAAHLLPDAVRLPLISLIPDAAAVPDSSLSHMITTVAAALAASTEYFVDAQAGIDSDALVRRLRALERAQLPALVVGTSFAFVHFIDALRERGERLSLAPGTRLMDTGGFKGRSRSVAAAELREQYAELLGVPESHVVNEYGMTELCSQFYDDTLRAAARGAPVRRIKVPPPWVRTRVVHPETLQPVAAGEVGILQHFDLANLHSVMAVQTEDLGRAVEDGFELLGRAAGSPPRGCSIAMDLLLEATREREP